MVRYCFRKIEKQGVGDEFQVDGEIVETYNDRPYNKKFVALVRLAGDADEGDGRTTETPEGIDEPTCSGKDGECSRTVENEGGRCWQHPRSD